MIHPLKDKERFYQANEKVKNYVIGAMAVSLVPIPMIDLVMLSGLQLSMLHNLATFYQTPFNQNLGKSMIASLLGSLVPASTSTTLASLAKGLPVVGTTMGAISMSIIAGASTYAIGRVFIQHFEAGGTFLNFDPSKVREHFIAEFTKGQEIAAELKNTNTHLKQPATSKTQQPNPEIINNPTPIPLTETIETPQTITPITQTNPEILNDSTPIPLTETIETPQTITPITQTNPEILNDPTPIPLTETIETPQTITPITQTNPEIPNDPTPIPLTETIETPQTITPITQTNPEILNDPTPIPLTETIETPQTTDKPTEVEEPTEKKYFGAFFRRRNNRNKPTNSSS